MYSCNPAVQYRESQYHHEHYLVHPAAIRIDPKFKIYHQQRCHGKEIPTQGKKTLHHPGIDNFLNRAQCSLAPGSVPLVWIGLDHWIYVLRGLFRLPNLHCEKEIEEN